MAHIFLVQNIIDGDSGENCLWWTHEQRMVLLYRNKKYSEIWTTVKPVFKTTWEIGTPWELRTAASVRNYIQYMGMDLRNKTTSEFRTLFPSPLGVPNSRFHCTYSPCWYRKYPWGGVRLYLLGTRSFMGMTCTISCIILAWLHSPIFFIFSRIMAIFMWTTMG